MEGGSFLQRWVSLETMSSSFPLKLDGEDEVMRELTIGKMRECGFMNKAREAWPSFSTCGRGQFQAREGESKNAHFSRGGGRSPGIKQGGVGGTRGGQREAHGLGKNPLEAWARRWSVCVCVCMRSSTHEAFH